ncbi:MAG: ABC transporter permease [Anaerolineae bacterium]|nr:ABC transporter permease [Anaerolineae bacterium]
MPPILKFLLRRLFSIPVTLFVVTAVLYGIIMLAPVEERAKLYLPRGDSKNPNLRTDVVVQQIIEAKGLNDPYPVQYARWVSALLQGDWGWSPALRGDVLEALLVRTPATVELTLYSVMLLAPLGIASGVIASHRAGRLVDHGFRLMAFIGASIPPFVLALVLLTIFYAGLRWFPPGRISAIYRFTVEDPSFKMFTGLLTVDGFLNGSPEISIDALRHLVLPAFTLSLAHWATLGRVTRITVIEELEKDYITAGRGRGLKDRTLLWRHALRNALAPALNSIALSAASLVTGVFVVEVVFGIAGVSELVTGSLWFVPDLPVAMGFSVYSVLLVLPLMLILDILQAVVDPRIREGVAEL